MGSLANTAYGPPRDAFRDGCTASSCAWWHGAVLSKGSGSLVACSRPSHAISCEQDARHAAPRGGVGEEVALGLPLVACSRWQAARRRRMGYWQSASHAKDEAMVMCYGKRLANACLIGWSFEASQMGGIMARHGSSMSCSEAWADCDLEAWHGKAWQGMAWPACLPPVSQTWFVHAGRPSTRHHALHLRPRRLAICSRHPSRPGLGWPIGGCPRRRRAVRAASPPCRDFSARLT